MSCRHGGRKSAAAKLEFGGFTMSVGPRGRGEGGGVALASHDIKQSTVVEVNVLCPLWTNAIPLYIARVVCF